MEAINALWSIMRGNAWKVVVIFLLGGTAAVVGLVPGTQNLSNVIGEQITTVKTSIGTAASPTIVQ